MKSYEYSYSDGEVDEAQGYPSDDEVPSEPVRECKRLSRLNTTGTLGRAALKVQSYKCVPAVHFLNRFKAYFPYAIVLMMLLNVGL